MYLSTPEAIALVGASLVLGVYLGTQWAREGPAREYKAAIQRHDHWAALMSAAQSELREHENRIREPDETTREILCALRAAVERFTPHREGGKISFPNITAWETDSAALGQATAAARQDRRRYCPALTPEDEARLREYGVNDPRLANPALGGVLRRD